MARWWSLRARFVLVAVACLVPLLVVVLFVLAQSIGNGREQLLQAQSATAEVVAQVLAATLDDNEQVLTTLGTNDRVRKLDPRSAQDVLDQYKSARPSLYGLFLTDANGQIVVSSGGLDPTQFRAMPSFSASIDHALKLGELGVSSRLVLPDAQVISLVVPVRAKDQSSAKPIAAVGGLLSIDRLKATVLPFARGDSVIAIAAQGEVIASQGSNLAENQLSAELDRPIADAMGGTIGTRTYVDAAGVERLAAFAPVPGVPGAKWAVLVTNPAPTTYAPNRMLIERGVAALGLAVAATLVLVLLLGEWIARPLRQLTVQASALARGDFGVRVTPAGGGEVAALGDAFREMADQLTAKVRALEVAQEEDAAQAEQMRELNRRTVRLQEDERRRLAGEIHDAVAPLITGALYQARALRLAVGVGQTSAGGNGAPNGEPGGETETAEGLDAVSDLLERATEELHGVIFALRPPDLDDIGVVAAIERHLAGVDRAGLHCRLELVGEHPHLMPEVRLAIYRIVQEALHNALRHGGADQAVVRLETTDRMLCVTIQDNGAGFNPEVAHRPTALGLLSMRERAAAIGATFAIASRPGDGTTVTIERRIDPDPPEEVMILDPPAGAPDGAARP